MWIVRWLGAGLKHQSAPGRYERMPSAERAAGPVFLMTASAEKSVGMDLRGPVPQAYQVVRRLTRKSLLFSGCWLCSREVTANRPEGPQVHRPNAKYPAPGWLRADTDRRMGGRRGIPHDGIARGNCLRRFGEKGPAAADLQSEHTVLGHRFQDLCRHVSLACRPGVMRDGTAGRGFRVGARCGPRTRWCPGIAASGAGG